MINKAAIFAGAVGGVAPNLVRLIVNYSSPTPQPITSQPVSYCMAMVGFAALGALVVWAFQETNLKQALFIGVGLPSLLQVATLQSSVGPEAKSPNAWPQRQTSLSLVSSAYAQELPPQSNGPSLVPGRKLTLIGDAQTPPYVVAFFDASGRLQSTQNITKPTIQIIDVPEAASKFGVQVGNSYSDQVTLSTSPNAVISVDVTLTAKSSSGFLQGLGFVKAGDYDIKLASREVQPLPPGRSGWSFLGQYSQGRWTTEYVKLSGPDHLPTAGEVGTVTFPIRLRDAPSPQAKELGVALVGQKLRISSTKDEGQGLHWAAVTVVQ
jgi:hypothetical protein